MLPPSERRPAGLAYFDARERASAVALARAAKRRGAKESELRRQNATRNKLC